MVRLPKVVLSNNKLTYKPTCATISVVILSRNSIAILTRAPEINVTYTKSIKMEVLNVILTFLF